MLKTIKSKLVTGIQGMVQKVKAQLMVARSVVANERGDGTVGWLGGVVLAVIGILVIAAFIRTFFPGFITDFFNKLTDLV